MFGHVCRMRIMLTAVIAAAWLGAGPLYADEVVANVNGEEISESQFLEALKLHHGQSVLRMMIEAAAIRQEAAKRDIKVAAEEIEGRYQQSKEQVVAGARSPRPPEEVFAAWLAQQHLTEQVMRERIALGLMLEKMVEDQVEITSLEVGQYYESHPEEFERPQAMEISHVCVTTQQEAEKIGKDIVEGRITFEEAARQYSIDPYGRENGGEIGFVTPGEDPLQQAAFQLTEDGEISPTVHTTMGYHLVRREAYQEEGTIPFGEVQDQIEQGMRRSQLLRGAEEMRRAIMQMAEVEQFVQFAQPAGPDPGSTE